MLPPLSDDDSMAFRVVTLLKNGQGGIDWAGLPIVVGWIGIVDIDGLLHRLNTILNHRPEKD